MLQQQNILHDLSQRQAAGEVFALATVVRAVSPTAAHVGAKALVFGNGAIEGWIGGGCAQPAVIKTAQGCLQDGQSRLIRVSPESDQAMMEGMEDFKSHCHSGGSLDIFIEPIATAPSLWVFGSSPAAEALVALAARTGFSVTVLAHGVSKDAFPDAKHCIDGFKADGAPNFVVVSTQGKGDLQALSAALSSNAPFISMIASQRKGYQLKNTLIERDFNAERVANIVCPCGLDIGAETPEEVALSVLSALVAHRRLNSIFPNPVLEEESTAPSCCSSSELEAEEPVSCCGGAA